MKTEKLIERWQESKLITKKQATSMLEDVEQNKKDWRSKMFTVTLSVIGSVFLGIGLIMFFATNWESLGRLIKSILIILLPVVPLIIGYKLAYKKDGYPILGKSLILLGAILIGASIGMFVQLYNLSPEVTGVVGIWLIFVTILAYILRFNLLSVFHTGLLVVFINAAVAEWLPYNADESFWLFFNMIAGAVLLVLGTWFMNMKNGLESFSKVYKVTGLWLIMFTAWMHTIGAYVDYVLELGSGYALLFHVLYILLLGELIYVGIKRHIPYVLRTGFFWTTIYLISTYLDLFWGLFDRALTFIGAGLLAIGVGYFLEKKRKLITQSWNNEK